MVALASLSTASASPTASSMREGGYALAPFSFVKFCLDYPGDCPKFAGPGRIHLTNAHMAELANVNRAVNAAIRPTPDTSAMRFWKLDVSAGDCNAYAVEKRHQLIRRGWPAAALALTVAKTAWGEGHLVVTVRTDQGDLVLDNLRSTIIAWQKTGYDFIMRQSEANPQFWVVLDGGEAGAMTAAAEFGGATEVAEAGERASVADDATQARRQILIDDITAADAGTKRASVARLAPVQTANTTVVVADITVAQVLVPRSPDVASLQADAGSAALEEASRLATTAADLGFARPNVPRPLDVGSLEAEAATAVLRPQPSQFAQATDPTIAVLPRWFVDAGQSAASIADGLVATLDRWYAASETAWANPIPEEARQDASTGPADLDLRGFI